MPPPPPPPPAAPPPPGPPPALNKLGGGAPKEKDRNNLLKDIRLGAKLKPTQTNDRSAPIVGGSKSSTGSSGASPSGRSDTQSSQLPGPLPGIGGLFAGGIPTLKKTKGGINTGRVPGRYFYLALYIQENGKLRYISRTENNALFLTELCEKLSNVDDSNSYVTLWSMSTMSKKGSYFSTRKYFKVC